jgi:predicted transcriptional regulator
MAVIEAEAIGEPNAHALEEWIDRTERDARGNGRDEQEYRRAHAVECEIARRDDEIKRNHHAAAVVARVRDQSGQRQHGNPQQ